MNRRVFLAGVLALPAAPAVAHSWYDLACCSGRDCAPIPPHAVSFAGGAYAISLQPGEHPLVVDAPFFGTIPVEKIRPSQDGRWHACIDELTRKRLLCVYAPEAGT